MKCTRCHGLMVTDDLLDLQESYLPMWMRGLRCISCGNIVDPLINRNRMIQQASAAGRPKPEVRIAVLSRPARAA
jgi:hypothetical protein